MANVNTSKSLSQMAAELRAEHAKGNVLAQNDNGFIDWFVRKEDAAKRGLQDYAAKRAVLKQIRIKQDNYRW